MGPSLGFVSNVFFTRPRMGPSLGFVTNVFFSVDLCYMVCLLHHLICNAPLLSLIAPLELYCASVS